ncbi:histidine kinase [Patulibacter brassicae]|uniref:Histidine kinase n=1 Tax=Patulibacter brassicae TaxID=1705717 RepID=A0ABU4VJ96_9ACTN|nr:histidine kinase [Patulibacter brassicae]MDX8151769.1 histidine kinase [Patulibacter brassicae]
MPRGRHTVMLGMAPGVGKTYRALQDLRRARDAGRAVLIAVLETHGRAETAAQADGLPILPRRTVAHRGLAQEELDLPALLALPAGPATVLVLIDELAHANPPGLEHPKRWQDVEDVLAAGIDVVSTVNVQHLESLNDQVAELTGVRVRETVPDHVLVDAEDVVVVDLPPDALLQRLRDGQIYPPERIGPALRNFFRIEQLTALRETALLQAAEEVGARRTRLHAPRPRRDDESGERRAIAGEVPDAVHERLLALVSAHPSGQRVLRRAWRSARRLRAPLVALHVRHPGRAPDAEAAERLAGLSRLATQLGVRLEVEEDDDLVAATVRVARRERTTYLLLGVPRRRVGDRWRRPLALRLLAALPGVDVRLVADRDERPERSG